MVLTAEKYQHPLGDSKDEQNPGPLAPDAGIAKPDADRGSEFLPSMEHFVRLMRKVRNVPLLKRLLKTEGIVVPDDLAKKMDRAKGVLPPPARRQLYPLVAVANTLTRQRLERIAERISLLDNDYGKEAVLSLLNSNNPRDVFVLSFHGDPHGRALYLYLEQEYPEKESNSKTRFDQAERVQVMNRQTKSEAFSSHYRGPKTVTPGIDETVKQALRARILELFPDAPHGDVLIEHFTRMGGGQAAHHDDEDDGTAVPVLLDIVTVTFNGSEAHYTKVENGEEVAHDDLAALSVRFAYERGTGAISVFSDNREIRRELAGMFRDVVLAASDEIDDLPIQEFNLSGFASEMILSRLETELVPGIESISIARFKVARSLTRHVVLNAREGREMDRQIISQMAVMRDRYDDRDIYQVARDEFKVDDLSQFDIAQVTLKMRIARQQHRKAHDVSVQITAPHGLNDKMKTEDDRKLVMAQLVRLGILIEF